MRYAFIDVQREYHAVSRLCRCLAVSRSGYYRWCNAEPNRYVEANRRLCEQVEQIHYANHQAYGTRRIKVVLQRQGHRVSRQRVAAAKRRLGLYTQRRRPKPGLIHHSDRGAAYTAGRYQQLLASHGMLPSLSRPANCLDNAAMESFFSTLKNERTHHEKYATRAEARQSVYDYIERFYNPKRMHSTLGYYSPIQYEKYGNVA